MSFGVEDAVRVANQLVLTKAGRPLSDTEVIVLQGAWERMDYDQIAAQHQYSTSYLSNDVAPKLWRLLSNVLGEKVRKSNFKEALRRYKETLKYYKAPPASTPSQSPSTPVAAITPAAGTTPAGTTPTATTPTATTPAAAAAAVTPATAIANQASPPRHRFAFDERYIPRPPIEQKCYDTICQPGSLLRIKAPKQMGKTALVNYLFCQFDHQKYRIVYLSLELSDRRKHLVDLSQFLRWFCLNISRELGIPSELDEYWDEEGLGAKVSCTTYFEQYLLPYANIPLVLCLDNVDLLFPYPEVYEDFFGLLRSWYEKARSRQVWKQLRLVIVHSTDVYIRLNIYQSPFNVGVPISLPDLTLKQARILARSFKLEGTVEQVKPLLDWLGGHPYLLSLALTELANRGSKGRRRFLAELPTNAGIYGAHLREHLLNVTREEELAIALKQVIHSEDGVTLKSMVAYQLQSMGLISLVGNVARSRCQLYTHYFKAQFADRD